MLTGRATAWDPGYGDMGGLWGSQGDAGRGSRGGAMPGGTETQG